MRVTVKFHVGLTGTQARLCINYAKELGLDFDNPDETLLLQRLFVQHGTSAKESAQNRKEAACSANACSHGISFAKHCGQCEASMHAEPAQCKPRRG